MPLTAPNLDSRRFQDLVDEAAPRIPRYTPEWTNFNDSDPGMTLVKLHAWMTETILFSSTRCPTSTTSSSSTCSASSPEPAHPARDRAHLHARQARQALRPAGRLPAARHEGRRWTIPTCTQEVVFETDAPLIAVNAAIGAVIVPERRRRRATRQLVTHLRRQDGHHDLGAQLRAVRPAPQPGAASIVGLVLRPLLAAAIPAQLCRGQLPRRAARSLRRRRAGVRPGPGPAPLIEGPLGTRCTPPGTAGVPVEPRSNGRSSPARASEGALFEDDSSDGGWTELNLTQDCTRGLSALGPCRVGDAGRGDRDRARAPSRGFWASFGAARAAARPRPSWKQQLREAARSTSSRGSADDWDGMGATAEPRWTTVPPAARMRSGWQTRSPIRTCRRSIPTALDARATGWIESTKDSTSRCRRPPSALRRLHLAARPCWRRTRPMRRRPRRCAGCISTPSRRPRPRPGSTTGSGAPTAGPARCFQPARRCRC